MKLTLAIAALCLGLAACASTGRLSTAQKLDLYRAHAGPLQQDMPLYGSLSGWTALGDSALAVWTRPSEGYLLDLAGPCQGLDYASAIGLTSRIGRVSSRFDKVLVRDPTAGPVNLPCFISSIRKLDTKALRASEQELRQAQVQEREEGQQSPTR
ncbi:hypothetical protein BCL79_2669 [Stenotrophomonas rhizophila]|uniref:Lipoprotein n=1 Tax=Stenotrophomonas rhizophila TaxID=216778 RepID=A0A498CD39_9GAMM|nr:DUF6491 family protein [Stenotrophomonas rhizophila]RLK53363.1 hypothetical protein BCL79_2669 [Stenotrophomonas rhizophila]